MIHAKICDKLLTQCQVFFVLQYILIGFLKLRILLNAIKCCDCATKICFEYTA